MFPEQQVIRLLRQWQIGNVIRMHKEMPFRLKETQAVTEESQMVLRDVLVPAPVTGDGLAATVLEPEIEFRLIPQAFEHHQFVIADQRNEMTLSHQFQQDLNHTRGIGPAIDKVSQADDQVFALGLNFCQYALERI